MPIETYEFTRQLIKHAKFASNEGDYTRAFALLMEAIGTTRDYGDPTVATPLAPHIRHRQGMAVKHLEGGAPADKYFDLAESLFVTHQDAIGWAITQRDRGLMWYDEEETGRGIDLIDQALESLAGTPSSERGQTEWMVTRGFLARTDAIPSQESLDIMMTVRDSLRGGTKLIYQLDNERAMLPLLQTGGYTRDMIDCRVRIFTLYRLIVALNHGFTAMDELMEGHFIGAAKEGVTGAYRLLPRPRRSSD